MAARFKYSRCLWLTDPAAYLLYGELVSGEIAVGMEVRFPLGASIFVTAPVKSVEYGDPHPSGSAQIALALGFNRRDEAELVCGRLSAGDELEVAWPLRRRASSRPGPTSSKVANR